MRFARDLLGLVFTIGALALIMFLAAALKIAEWCGVDMDEAK